MKHVLFKYSFEGGRCVGIQNFSNPEYDPTYPVNIYWVKQRRGGKIGVILGGGISTPKKARKLTHKEQRNLKRRKAKVKKAGEIKRTPEIKRDRAAIRKQIARFRTMYTKRQTPVAELIG